MTKLPLYVTVTLLILTIHCHKQNRQLNKDQAFSKNKAASDQDIAQEKNRAKTATKKH